MAESFAETVRRFAQMTPRKAEAVFKESTQRTIGFAQTTKGEGGDLPLATGFLRASGQVSLDGLPTGPLRGDENGNYTVNPDIGANIASAALGDTIWFGWTAIYARRQERANAFMRKAAQRWPDTVDEVAREYRGRTSV